MIVGDAGKGRDIIDLAGVGKIGLVDRVRNILEDGGIIVGHYVSALFIRLSGTKNPAQGTGFDDEEF